MDGTDPVVPVVGPMPQPPRKKRRLLLVIGVALVVLAALAAAGYALVVYSPWATRIQDARTILFLPAELKNAVFVSDSKDGTTLYHIHGLSFVAEPLDGTLISAEQTPGRIAEVVRTGTTSYRLLVNGTQAYATSAPLSGVSVTADGSRVVMAVQWPSGKEGTPLFGYSTSPDTHPRSWTSVIFHLEGNPLPYPIGAGISPVYTDATHILRVAPVGLVYVDMTNGNLHILVPHQVDSTASTVLASPDRTRMGWYDAKTRSYLLYTVHGENVAANAALHSFVGATSYALGNKALYAVHSLGIGKNTDILAATVASDAKPSVVAVLPAHLTITRILIGSL